MSFSKKLEKAFHDVDEGRKGRLDAAAAHAALVCAGSRPSLPLERIVALLPSYSASPSDGCDRAGQAHSPARAACAAVPHSRARESVVNVCRNSYVKREFANWIGSGREGARVAGEK